MSRFVPEESEHKNEVYVSSIALFREGVEPKWEDPKNQNGGHIEFNTEKIDQNTLDSIWETLVLHLISNSFFKEISEKVIPA
jgi:uncharacterized protein YjaG (DUF416 family)